MSGIDAIRSYIDDTGHNYRENVTVYVDGANVGKFAVNAKIETNDAFVEIFWNKPNERSYYQRYSYRYQTIEYSYGTLRIYAKDRSGNDIVITINE